MGKTIKSFAFKDAKDQRNRLRYNKAAERDFFRALKRVAENSGKIVKSHTKGAVIKDPVALERALKKYSEDIEPWAIRQAEKLLNRVGRVNKVALSEQSKTMAELLRSGVAEKDTGFTALSLLYEQVELIKSLPLEAGLRAQEIASKNFLEGNRAVPDPELIKKFLKERRTDIEMHNLLAREAGTKELAEEMERSTEVAVNRARLIARTETARANASFTQARAQAVGVKGYIWRASMDGATRKSHAEMDGVYVEYGKPPTLSDGTQTHAGEIYNCLPGSSRLTATPMIELFYRHPYCGEMITLVFDDGGETSCTPNHPILSASGDMLPAKDFNVGDNVFGYSEEVIGSLNKNVQCFDVSFEKLFNSVSDLPIFIKASSIGGEFHGDRTNEKVDVIRPDLGLIFKINTEAFQRLANLDLTDSDYGILWSLFSGHSSLLQLSSGPFLASDSIVSFRDLKLPLLRKHLTPLQLFCFAFVSYFNVGSDESSADDKPGNLKCFRDCKFAFSFLIHGYDLIDRELDHSLSCGKLLSPRGLHASSAEMLRNNISIESDLSGDFPERKSSAQHLRRIIEKRITKFSGHVYNLQTSSGFYLAENVIKSNCRCWQDPVLPK